MTTGDSTTTKPPDELREHAIQAAITEMSLFTGNLEMKVRMAIDRYEFILKLGRENGS